MTFVRTVALNRDSTQLATGGRDGTVIVWDTISRTAILELKGHENRVNVVAFNPDATQLVSAGADSDIIVWDTTSGDILETLNINSEEIRSASFSPDGETLVIANSAGEIARWSTEDYSLADITQAHDGGVIYDLKFSPDGSTMVTGGDDNSIHVWDTEDYSLRQVIPAHSDWVLSLAFSPDGQFVASGSVDRSVRVWDIASGENEWAVRAHQAEVFALTFSDDGQLLMSGGLDDFVIIWDALTGDVRSSFATFERTGIRSLVDHNNALYIAGDTNDVVEVNIGFVPRFGTELHSVQEEILTTALHPDGTIAFAGGTTEDFNIYIQEADSDTVTSLPLHTGTITGLAWSGDRLISVSVDRQVGIHENNELIGVITPDSSALSLAIHDNLLALGTSPGFIEIWDISGDRDSWSRIARLEGHRSRVNDLDFNADGTRLVSASLDASLIIWDTETFSAITDPLTGHEASVETVSYSPDDTLIASGSRDNTIILWNAETGEQTGPPLVQHENWVNDIAFSPDSELMASVSGDTSLILWSVGEQRAIGLPFIGHRDWVNSLSFSADNSYIISGGRDGSLLRWETSLETWINSACQVANRNLTPGEIRDFFSDVSPPVDACRNR